MQPDAEVRLPAETAYVAVLRMATSGIAARLDFTLDDIEDLKMAVSEACALVLDDATPGGRLHADYYLGESDIEVRISADAQNPVVPDQDSFTWQVLTTMASQVHAEVEDGRLAVCLVITSSANASA